MIFQHAIGMDLQQLLSILWLREGNLSSSHQRSIGDGRSHIIPNLADDKTWGSAALLANTTETGHSAVMAPFHKPTLFTNELTAATFWGYLYHRLYAFLGHLEPIQRNNYQAVIAVQSATYQNSSELIGRACRNAGLFDTTIIPATDALFTRWLCAPDQPHNQSEQSIVAIAIGDTSLDIRGYRLVSQSHLRSSPQILAISKRLSCQRCGLAYWADHLLQLVEERLEGALTSQELAGFWEIMLETGQRLQQVPLHQSLIWHGPGWQRLFADLQLSRISCSTWPTVEYMQTWLQMALPQVISELGNTQGNSIILIGGVGAAWPFISDSLRASVPEIPSWQSPTRHYDIAWGASCWPLLNYELRERLQQSDTLR